MYQGDPPFKYFSVEMAQYYSQQRQQPRLINQEQIPLEDYLGKLKCHLPTQCSDSDYSYDQLTPAFIDMINMHPFMAHCENVIIKRSSLFKSIPVQKIMTFQKVELDKALIIGPFKDLQKRAKEMFKVLLRYTSIKEVFELLEILKDGLLVDELYFQVIKQTTQNPESIMLHVQLLAVLCSFYPPSEVHLGAIVNYFYYQGMNERIKQLIPYWKFLIKRICNSFNEKVTAVDLPTQEEIISVMNLRPVIFRVDIYNGNHLNFEIESQTKVSQIIEELEAKLQVKQITLAMIQTIAGQIEESYLNPEQNISIIVRAQRRTIGEIKERIKNKILDCDEIIERIDGACKFVLKTTLKSLETIQDLTMAYIVTVQDYLNGYFTLNTKEIQLIAGLKLCADIGPYNDHVNLSFNHLEYIPLYKQNEMSSDQWLQAVLRVYLKQDKMSQREARKRLVEYFKTQFTFMAFRFQCRMYENVSQQTRIFLHVGFNGASCSNINLPRWPFLTNLEQVEKLSADIIQLKKENRIFRFKFPNMEQCKRALDLLEKSTSPNLMFFNTTS